MHLAPYLRTNHLRTALKTDQKANRTVKVQCGWKSKKSAIAEGMRIQYNFVKPHMALEGKTPAQAAELQVKGWKDLLTRGLNG